MKLLEKLVNIVSSERFISKFTSTELHGFDITFKFDYFIPSILIPCILHNMSKFISSNQNKSIHHNQNSLAEQGK